ncbi:MAG: OprO/OprP family phosphate-selective porin [Paramuribaculum sp.]|nr:OprO/OprP family phosphate-selective porin [Paramuribaculum sp.]
MKLLHLALVCASLAATGASAQTADSTAQSSKVSYLPHIHGVVRGRFEASTVESAYRFQVRNARLNVGGAIGPMVDYFLQADFCDRGKIKMLDAWIGLKPTKGLNLRVGQFRVPFGVNTFRAPNNYLFSNRSFLGKDCANYRAVGARVAYSLPTIPLTLEAGAFNPGTIGDHQPWHSTLTFASKATLSTHGFTASVSYLSHKPLTRRINYLDAALGWKGGRWRLDGEYTLEHPAGMGADGVSHAYLAQGEYAMPLRTKFFNQLSFEARFDGRTRAPEFSADPQSPQPCGWWEARRRITVGSTISHIRTANLQMHLRLDYEKYLYNSGVRPTAEAGDKAIVELVVTF